MPRTSPYTIRLSSAEAAELHRDAAKYTLPYFQVQPATMILLAALLCNYGRGFCLIDIGTEGTIRL